MTDLTGLSLPVGSTVPVCRFWLQTWVEKHRGEEGLCEVCSS